MEHLPEELNFIREHAEGIRLDFIHLTEQILKKDMKSANKQLQDTLMNYFLENQVGSLLKKPMNQNSKRAIRLHIEKELPETGTKYINLLNAFEKNLKQYEVANDYINLLKDIIVTPNNNEKSQDQWKALVRKRILAILLTVHWFVKNKEFNDFFQLWDEVYPNNPLPKRKPKQTRKKRNPDEKKKNLKIEEQSIPKIQNEDEDEDDEYDEDDHTQTQKQSSQSHLIKQEQQQQHQNYLDQYGNMNNIYNQQNFQNMQQQQIQQQIAAQQHSQPFINLKLLPMASQQFGQGQYNGGDESYRAQQGQYNLDANTQYILKNGLGAESPMNILSPNPRDRQQQQQYSQNNSPLNMNSSQLGMQYGQSNFSNVMNSYNYQNEFTPKLNNDKDQASYYQQMQMNYLMSTGQMTPFSNRGNTNFMNQDGNESKNFNQNNNTIAEENQESINGENQNNNNNDLYKLNGNTPLNFNQGQNGANFSQYLQIQKNNSSYAQSPQNNNNQLSHFASFVKNLNQNSKNDNDSQNKQNNEGNKNKSQMDQNGIPLDNQNNANNNNGNLNNNQKNQNSGNNNNQHLRKKVILLQQTSQNQQELSPLNSPGMNYGHSPGLMGKFPQSQFFQYSQQQKMNQQGQLINDEGNSQKMNQMKQVNFFKQNSYSLENTPQNILTQQFMNNNQNNNNNGNDIKFDFDVANSPNNLLFQKIWENQALSRNGSQEMNGYNFENDKSPFNQGQFFGGFHNMLNHQQSQINQQQFNLTQQQSQVLQHQQSQQPQFQQQQNQQLIQQQQNNNTNFNNNQIVQNNNIQNNNQTISNNNNGNQMEMEEQQQNQQEIQASSQ